MNQTPAEFTVAEVTLNKDVPTKLTFQELYTWVIWQFPKQKEGGLCGAVTPPITDYGWLPAIILFDEKCVRVYGHLDQKYESPEVAAEHFNHVD